MTGRYDEHDHEHYERPRRRTRPAHQGAPDATTTPSTAVVTTVDRGRFTLLVDGPHA